MSVCSISSEDSTRNEFDYGNNDSYEEFSDNYNNNLLKNNSHPYADFTHREKFNLFEIHKEHHDYPEQFKSSPGNEIPQMLFCIGNSSLFKNQVIMICGTRDASDYGTELAYKCGRLVADQGYTVASGYARGVDMAAHFGALEAGGNTIAFLPYGLLNFRINRAIRESFESEEYLFEQFLAVSDIPPSYPFSVGNALRRNKLLVTLSKVVIVIESGETGGTWFSAKYASKKNKPLYFFEGMRSDVIPKLESIGGKRLKMKIGAPDLRNIFKLLPEK
jgi:DNA processing protein